MRRNVRPMDNRPPVRGMLTREGVTGSRLLRTVSHVGEWSPEELSEYLDALMRAEKIRNDAELARLSGVKQTQISNWRRGLAQPTIESLAKIAPVLKVSPRKLYIVAGRMSATDAEPVDLAVTPPEIRTLIEIYNDPRMSDADHDYLRRSLTLLADGLRSDLERRDAPKRVSRGKPAA